METTNVANIPAGEPAPHAAEPNRALERAMVAARTAEDNRAQNIVILDLRELTPIFDYFVIVSGTVEITKGKDDDILRLAVMKRGDLLGEMALIDDQPRSASRRDPKAAAEHRASTHRRCRRRTSGERSRTHLR